MKILFRGYIFCFLSVENANSIVSLYFSSLPWCQVYDVVMEQKRMLRSKQSVIGRINTRQLQIEQEEKQRMLEEQEALQAMLSAGENEIVMCSNFSKVS